MQYDKEYFIKKFEAVPERKFGQLGLRYNCALAQCGVTHSCWGNSYNLTDEATSLIILFRGDSKNDIRAVTDVNDGIGYGMMLGSTPKQRILNRLKEL